MNNMNLKVKKDLKLLVLYLIVKYVSVKCTAASEYVWDIMVMVHILNNVSFMVDLYILEY